MRAVTIDSDLATLFTFTPPKPPITPIQGVRHPAQKDLEVGEVDILWPRWVASMGVTRATEACFLTADRQCTELPLLRLPRLVPEARRVSPTRHPQDLARVGWRGIRFLLTVFHMLLPCAPV